MAGAELINLGSITNLQTITKSGVINNSPGSSLTNDNTMTNGPSGVLTNMGSVENAGTLDNLGNVTDSYGGALANDGFIDNSGVFAVTTGAQATGVGSFVQSGGGEITVQSGSSVSQGNIEINGGTLSGGGSIASLGGFVVAAGAVVTPGDSTGSAGVLTISTPVGLQFDGNLNVGVYGPGLYDVLNVIGPVSFGSASQFYFNLTGDAAQQSGDSFGFLKATSFQNFTSVNFQMYGLLAGLDYSVTAQNGTGLVLNLFSAPSNPVPEPGPLALMAAGVLALGWRRRTAAS